MKLLRATLIGGLCLALVGCGFSLRSNDALTANISALQLDLAQPNGDIARLLRRSLDVASVTVLDAAAATASDSAPVLQLGAEQLVTRAVSVNPRARAAQYEVRLSVDVALMRGTTQLLGPETLLVERSYFEDIENIAGNQEELAIITSEMRRDLVNQLLRRLEAVTL